MLVFAVLSEALAVVGEDDQEGPVVEPLLPEKRKEAADDGVGGLDLAVVEVVRVQRPEGLRGVVRRVRLVEVEKGERRRVRRLPEPPLEQGGRLRPRPLDAALRLHRGRRLEAVLVIVEAAARPRARVQDDGRDRAARPVSRLLQQLGEGRDVGLQAVAEVVTDAVERGEDAGEERDVGRERQRHVRVGPREENGVLPELRHRRRGDPLVAIERQVVRPERVDRDEDHRRLREGRGRPSGAGAARGTGAPAGRHQGDEGQEEGGASSHPPTIKEKPRREAGASRTERKES